MKTFDDSAYYDKIKKLNITHYTGEIPYYANASFRRVEEKIVRSLKTNSKILDLGCGSGRFSIGASKFVGSVTGLDITPSAIEASNNRAGNLGISNTSFIVGDMTKIPFEDNTFDYVFCPRFSINAVATLSQRQKAINEMIRVVRPGGKIFIESFNNLYLGRGPLFLLQNLSRDVWRYFKIILNRLSRKEYSGLLPGDIVYKANKVTNASVGYAHLPTIFELRKSIPLSIPHIFYSIPQIMGRNKFDIFKYFRYSIWIFLSKPN